ncbi:hypothetical protein JKG47_03525 [Acidithiobacillus sp. MC6.1]|nr:hypothetical protein [Acidithiobacillus sp. MC6.1]
MNVKMEVTFGLDVSAYCTAEVDVPASIVEGNLVPDARIDIEAFFSQWFDDHREEMNFEPSWNDGEMGQRVVCARRLSKTGDMDKDEAVDVDMSLDDRPVDAGLALKTAAKCSGPFCVSESMETVERRTLANFKSALDLMGIDEEEAERLIDILARSAGYTKGDR